MALEIERKFLATSAVLPLCRSGTLLVQGYIYTDAHHTLRVRRAADRTFLTWKGPKSGAVREEVECEVPLQMGEALLADVPLNERVQKVRYRVEHAGAIWDVDVFQGALAGLRLAEIEMTREDEFVALPFWLGREVTSDQRYRNSRLATETLPNLLAA
jgi:adenylate cyclase